MIDRTSNECPDRDFNENSLLSTVDEGKGDRAKGEIWDAGVHSIFKLVNLCNLEREFVTRRFKIIRIDKIC